MNKNLVIRAVPFFSSATDDDILKIEKISTVTKYNCGEIIFLEGEVAKRLSVLIDGVVEIVKTSEDGRELLVRKITRHGEVFGEAAVFYKERYPATAIAKTSSSVLHISKDGLVDLIKQNPDFAMRIIGTMAKLLHHLNALLEQISFRPVLSRLASYLLALSRQFQSVEFKIPIKKRELAFQIGTVSETLSRNLRKLVAGGIIEMNRDIVIIRDEAALRRLAGEV
jgi:CRP/FNR family transcriptional regulator